MSAGSAKDMKNNVEEVHIINEEFHAILSKVLARRSIAIVPAQLSEHMTDAFLVKQFKGPTFLLLLLTIGNQDFDYS